MWADVDLVSGGLSINRGIVELVGDTGHIGPPKSRRSRRALSIGPESRKLLEKHRLQREAQLKSVGLELTLESQVCVMPDGRLMKPSALSHNCKPIMAKAGIECARFHDLRHTHATLLLESGVPVHVVQARLGHESIQATVDTYGHVLPASDFEASEVVEDRTLV